MKLSPSEQSSVRSLRLLLAVALCLAAVPLVLKAAAPGWWSPGVVDPSKEANDFAAINQGQVKNLAMHAMLELDVHLPGVQSGAIHEMVDGWNTSTATTNDYSPVKLGALKALAKPFYTELIRVGYTNNYPWIGKEGLANDYAAANIGQAKNLFSFDFVTATTTNDTNHDGIADWWEQYYFHALTIDPTADPDADGLTNLQEFLRGTNPLIVTLDINGLPFDWEMHYFGHPGVDPSADEDGDGLTNLQEFQLYTDPTDPLNSLVGPLGDGDHNGLADWWEILNFGHIGNDPSQTVAIKGGLTLKQIFDNGLDPSANSTVGDGIPDAWKIQHYLNPLDPNVANEDPDDDKLTNADEYAAGTDPTSPDTDGDDVPDGQDMAPLVVNPADPRNLAIDVPSRDVLSQQPNFDPFQVDYTSIQVQWEAANYGGTVTAYRIEKRVDSNPWEELAIVGPSTTSRADAGLVAGRQYQYRIVAITDSGNTHVESNGVIARYQVPLGLRLAVKQSALTGLSANTKSKYGFSEFTSQSVHPSTPPKFYLVNTRTSSVDEGEDTTDRDTTRKGTSTGKFTYVETRIPDQHTHAYESTVDSDADYTTRSPNNDIHETNGSHGAYDYSEQLRGKGQPISNAHGKYHDDRYSTYSGPPSTFDTKHWEGTYQLGGTYHSSSGTSQWMGSEFDLTKGTISYAGHSTSKYSDKYNDGTNGSQGSSDPNSANAGVWQGSITYSYERDDQPADPDSTYPLNGPAWDHSWVYGSSVWFKTLIDTQLTKRSYSSHQSSEGKHTDTAATEVLSEEYVTSAFISDTIKDLPDYPTEWNNNYYGWGYYNWGYWSWDGYSYEGSWYPYGYPWYGWWIAERHLSTDESRFAISKMKYKFTANPCATMTMKWYEVFVPEDDPSTQEVDESKNIKIVAERTWVLGTGQNECPEYEVDPSTRSDGNGYYTLLIQPAHLSTPDLGEAGKDITGRDTDPGKVILVNDGDADDDGIPNYADGYRLRDGNSYKEQGNSSNFTPIYVNWVIADPQHAKVKFTYDASDPFGVTRAGSDLYVLPNSGKIRIWKKDSFVERNGHDVKEGGDFIKPGIEYSLQDLGLNPAYYWYGGMTFYVEAIKISSSVADIPIEVEVDPTGTLNYPWSDVLRFTVSSVKFIGFDYNNDGNDGTVMSYLIPSSIASLSFWESEYTFTPGSYLSYRARVHDPRMTLNKFIINHVHLPLSPSSVSGVLETSSFVCVRPGAQYKIDSPFTLVPLTTDENHWSYNPDDNLISTDKLKLQPSWQEEMAKAINKVSEAIKDEGDWGGTRSEYGAEFERRVRLQIGGDRLWVCSIRVDDATNKIVSIQQNLSPTTNPTITGTTEVDFARLIKGHTIKTGDTWDPTKIERLYDMKAKISGSMDAGQKRRLLKLAGGDTSKLYIARTPWIIDGAGRFARVPRFEMFKLVFKVSVAGVGASLYVLNALQVDDYLDQFQNAFDGFEESGRQNLYWRIEMERSMGDAIDILCVDSISAVFLHKLFTDKFIDDLSKLSH